MHEGHASQVRVLAIDDHPEVLSEVARILHRLGYECLRASGLAEAAAQLDHHAPDLVIADVSLARHGIQAFCDELRRSCELEVDVPVMFLSSMQSPDIIRRADAGGGTYYLRKPFDAPVFVELVERTRRTPRPHHMVAVETATV
jgi:CheY-like chemotaxis protein